MRKDEILPLLVAVGKRERASKIKQELVERVMQIQLLVSNRQLVL